MKPSRRTLAVAGNPSQKPVEVCADIKSTLPIRDAMDILYGKWKLPIMGTLLSGPKRFKVLQREVKGITAKMLSKELKDLEMNDLVKRTVYDTMPVTVEYELTGYGSSLKRVVTELYEWGVRHRKRIIGKERPITGLHLVQDRRRR